jgi:transcription-repair coupling factor (superfamily II helicase)
MQDLQIRGAGDILGIRQSGKTNDVGISLYMTLLEDAISALKTGKQHFRTPCKIDLPFSLYLEDELFESEADKMQFYRGLEAVRNTKELDTLIASFDE